MTPIYRSIPNVLTLARIVVIPFVVAAFYLPAPLAQWTTFSLFVFAAITDFLDGFLARFWNVQSSFGRILDPIADKLLVAAVIVMLVHVDRADVVPAILIMLREMLVSGLREFLAEVNVRVAVSNLAKVKTAVQMVALALLLLGSEASGIAGVDSLGRVALWLAALLTLITGYAYLKAGMKHIS